MTNPTTPSAVETALPLADAVAASGGWTYDPKFLESIADTVEVTAGDGRPSMEQVEGVLKVIVTALARAAAPGMPERGEAKHGTKWCADSCDCDDAATEDYIASLRTYATETAALLVARDARIAELERIVAKHEEIRAGEKPLLTVNGFPVTTFTATAIPMGTVGIVQGGRIVTATPTEAPDAG